MICTPAARPANEPAAVTKEFRKLLDALDLYRPGRNFYGLRHTFRTVADATRDFPAIRLIMGHVDAGIDAHYREQVDDDRLRAVTDHVRAWLLRQLGTRLSARSRAPEEPVAPTAVRPVYRGAAKNRASRLAWRLAASLP